MFRFRHSGRDPAFPVRLALAAMVLCAFAHGFPAGKDGCPANPLAALNAAWDASRQAAPQDSFWKAAAPILSACAGDMGNLQGTLLPAALFALSHPEGAGFKEQWDLSEFLLKAYRRGGTDSLRKILGPLKEWNSRSASGEHLLERVVPALFDDVIAMQIASLKSRPPERRPIPLPAPSGLLSSRAPSAGSAVYPDWRRMAGYRELYAARLAEIPGTGTLSYLDHHRVFWAILIDYLSGAPARESLAKVPAFAWIAGCGNGSEGFILARAKATASMLLAMGEAEAAVGALVDALDDEPRYRWQGDTSATFGNLRRLLARLGEPWEPFFLGLAAERNMAALAILTKTGGERAIAGLLGFDSAYAEDNIREYAEAIGSLIQTRCRIDPKRSRYTFRGRSGPSYARGAGNSLPPAAQRRAAERLAKLANGVRNANQATELAETIAKTCHPALLPAALKLAALPYAGPRKELEDFFAQAGVRPPVARLSERVAFSLTLNGFPLADREVQWSMSDICPTADRCGSRGSLGKTDADGWLEIERDNLVPGGNLMFSSATPNGRDLRAFYSAELELPREIPDSLAIAIEAGALRVGFTGALAGNPAARRVWLQSREPYRADAAMGRYALTAAMMMEHIFRADEEVHFPSLPPGRYSVCVSASGWGYACSGEVVVEARRAARIDFVPEPGADLVYRLFDQDSGRAAASQGLYVSLTRVDGKTGAHLGRETYSPAGFHGLSKGEYALMVRDQGAIARMMGRNDPEPEIPDALRDAVGPMRGFVPKQVLFTVDEKSPPLIDLGDIGLARQPR